MKINKTIADMYHEYFGKDIREASEGLIIRILNCPAIIDVDLLFAKVGKLGERNLGVGNGTPGDWSENTWQDLAYTQAEENTDHNFY